METLLPRIAVLPGEDARLFEDLHAALLADLAPVSPYERLEAENLIASEWELMRQRRMRDAGIRNAVRWTTVHRLQRVRLRGNLTFETNEEEGRIAAALVSDDPSETRRAELDLAARGIDRASLLADAYVSSYGSVEIHERMIASLEIRCRRRRDDYDKLKRRRRPPVDDAEIVCDGD